MFSGNKLSFEISDEPSEISIEQAICGSFGTVRLGVNGVALWVPGDDVPLEKEMIFDIRNRPLTEQDAVLFKEACKGRFINHYMALIQGTDEERIRAILNHFDFVLVPNNSIKNTPDDFGKRVLSYSIQK